MGCKRFIGLAMLLVFLRCGSAPVCACNDFPCEFVYFGGIFNPPYIYFFYGYPSVCVSYGYTVSFPGVTLAEGTERAHYSDEDVFGCKDICVMTTTGEVCKDGCAGFFHPLDEIIRVDELPLYNAICTNPYVDVCCPHLGSLCDKKDTECVLPRCTLPQIEGCFQCKCPEIGFELPAHCPGYLTLPKCELVHAFECCAKGKDCVKYGSPYGVNFGDYNPDDYRFNECPENAYGILPCEGTVVSDENCCPIACVPGAPCDCNGLSDGNTDTWNIDIQRDNSQDPYDVAGSTGVNVGGPKRVFVTRADNSEFCISSLSISVECMTSVYIKIYQMQDGKPQPIAINENIAVPVASQTGVYTATFDYPDTLRRVVSFRLGFKKEKSAACAGKSSASNLVVQPCQAK